MKNNNPHLRLKKRRLELELTQQAVADRAKILIRQYQRLESGEKNINRASFYLACNVLEALELDIVRFFHAGQE